LKLLILFYFEFIFTLILTCHHYYQYEYDHECQYHYLNGFIVRINSEENNLSQFSEITMWWVIYYACVIHQLVKF